MGALCDTGITRDNAASAERFARQKHLRMTVFSPLRRNLAAVSGWGVKGLLWQQMDRQAARSMLISRLLFVCRLSRNAADT